MNNNKYFLYARKSTDVEDKQVLSIEAQITELRAFAKQEGLHIAEEFIEKQSAKIIGRPIFNKMILRIENGDANGILAWHPDRLARNSVDGGKIIYLLDGGGLADLKFPQFWCENTSQGKFMLNIAFGQSKYYVDSLAENTKRGLRQKVRRGEYPCLAPIGYINDVRTKTVVVDKKRASLIRKAFEMYAQGKSRYDDIARFLFENGIATGATRGWTKGGGKQLKKDQIAFLLSNPFYIGRFRYSGEMYDGTHTPIVSKELFDQVQKVLRERSNKNRPPENNPQAYCGLLSCSECGCSITAEEKVKHQQNGNTHRYVYYHCTKKRGTCDGAYLREEMLDAELSDLLSRFHLPPEWAKEMERMATEDAQEAEQSATASISAFRAENTL